MLPILRRSPRPLLGLLACASLAGACRHAPAPASDALSLEIREATRALEERFRSRDLLGVANAYADDAILLGPDGYRVEGRQEIDDYWSRITDPLDWRLVTHSIGGGEGIAVQRGTSFLSYTYDGAPHTSEVEFALVWRKDGAEGWRIVVDTYWRAGTEPPAAHAP